MGVLEGKVVLITGAGRGQGRSHAVRMAEEGADIIAIDICAPIESVAYPMSSQEDLEETGRLVEDHDRRCVARIADVRDIEALYAAARAGAEELGGIDIVIANAGILHYGSVENNLEDVARNFHDAIDVLLVGVFNTLHAVHELMIEQDRGGSIILTSSVAGLKGLPDASGGGAGYTAAKHGVVGLMRSFAKLLGPHNIRVNSVHPTSVKTDMITNPAFLEFAETRRSTLAPMTRVLPTDVLQPGDVTDAIIWLASDASKYVTGVALPIDAGAMLG